jgi:phosphoribosyl 1,2-cyclic phosphodiesterase
MPITLTSLNSGSNGNCYYIGNDTEAVFIDAGISCRETEKRMKKLGLEMEKVKAIFVSHEHSDHITGIPALSKKYQLPIYLTGGTHRGLPLPVTPELVNILDAPVTVRIGGLDIISFKKHHDAADPISFVVSDSKTHVGIFTDIGHNCKEMIRHFSQCHAAILESNYCETMLENGSYPRHLKERIRGKKGHLSNDQALELFLKYRNPSLSHLILGHLSQNNNSMEKVRQVFAPHAANTEIIIASRYKETDIISIENTSPAQKIRLSPNPKKATNQLSLF